MFYFEHGLPSHVYFSHASDSSNMRAFAVRAISLSRLACLCRLTWFVTGIDKAKQLVGDILTVVQSSTMKFSNPAVEAHIRDALVSAGRDGHSSKMDVDPTDTAGMVDKSAPKRRRVDSDTVRVLVLISRP
jgi:hypothetical protein